jgi:hypothetical protein
LPQKSLRPIAREALKHAQEEAIADLKKAGIPL